MKVAISYMTRNSSSTYQSPIGTVFDGYLDLSFCILYFVVSVDTAPSTSAKASSGIKGKKAIVNVLPDNRIAASPSASLVTAGQLDENESNNNTKEDAAQTLEENLTHLKLDKNSRQNKSNKAMLQYQPEKWMLSDEEQLPSQLNLAIVSHPFC